MAEPATTDPSLAFEEGRRAHPRVDLPREAFERHWQRVFLRRERRTERPKEPGARDGDTSLDPGSPPSSMAVASAADLYLAGACDAGIPAAWEALQEEYVPRLRGLLRSRGASGREASEFLDDLPGFLCERPAGGEGLTRIGTYDGSGHLFAWLAVLCVRQVNERRRASAAPAIVLEDASDPSTHGPAPLRGTVADETARRFSAALAGAWDALTPRERLVVLWKHRDRLPGKRIAALLGVGEPRVSRLLESGLSRLRDAIRREMPETPPGTRTPDAPLWQEMAVVLARHLATLEEGPHLQNGSPHAP